MFGESASGSIGDIITELTHDQVESKNMTRLMPNEWSTIHGNNSVVFTTFHSDFSEDDARKVVTIFEKELKKSHIAPAHFAGMDSAGTFNSNTRTGIETRIWFNQLSEDSSDLIGALKKLVSKNISLATIFKCQAVPSIVARYYIENTSGVPMQNIMRALTFGDVRPSEFHWGRRAWSNSASEPNKELSNSDSCYVTLTHRSIGSELPRGNFKIEVLTMIGNVTQISVNMGFVYSKEPSFIPREINNYKKTSCRYWNETQTCKYGLSCTFAHGDHDLSLNPPKASFRNPFFRSKMCRSVS